MYINGPPPATADAAAAAALLPVCLLVAGGQLCTSRQFHNRTIKSAIVISTTGVCIHYFNLSTGRRSGELGTGTM